MNEITTLLEWNAWANEKYRQVLKDIPIDKMKIGTPYGRLLDRIVHIFASFKMWQQRMEGQSPQSVIKADDFDGWDDLFITWKEYEHSLINFSKGLSPDILQSEVSYTSLDGNTYTRQIRHIMLHLTAHQNYHRGQISAIFKERKLSPLPSTDMVIYFLQQS